MNLAGKRVVITAAASGMGRAGVERFAREGAHVVAVDINQQALDAMIEGLPACAGKVTGLTADLLDVDQCKSFVNEAAARLGGLDVLWNHAGMPGRSAYEDDFDVAEYGRSMDLNVRAGITATSAAIRHLRAAGGGAILFTSSISGLKGAMVSPVYSTAKFAVIGMTRSLALRYAKENIRVNVLCPGPIETPMLPQFMDPAADPERAKELEAKVRAGVPMGRVGRPEEVAAAAVWLASDEASFITGVFLPVDGGVAA